MILNFIEIVLFILVLALITNMYESHKKKNKSKISFKESMDLTELPVVTFYNNNNKLNFLLDTGSNLSVINESVLGKVKHTLLKEACTTIGLGGSMVSNKCSMIIYYKDQKFEDKFTIANMDAQFNQIKKEDGVLIHGILGSKFFEKYKYVLDFKDLIAYMK